MSAFDHVLEPGIPGKGELLTALSLWWFEQLPDVPEPPRRCRSPAAAPNAMLVRKLDMYPIECVVRGYLSGSGWVEYQATQSVCGVPLPAGLADGDRLPEPIYTPAFKAPHGRARREHHASSAPSSSSGEPIAAALRDASLERLRERRRRSPRRAASSSPTPSSSSAPTRRRACSPSPTRCSPATAVATGMPRSTRPATAPRASTSRSCATGSPPTGTSTARRPRCRSEIVEQTAARYRELIERLTGVAPSRGRVGVIHVRPWWLRERRMPAGDRGVAR